MIRAIIFSVLLPASALAQSVDIKDVAADGEQSTTIEIRKGKAGDAAKSEIIWELADGNVDIAGDTAPVTKEAKANWKKACDDWKKEFRSDNKENKIISMNCGLPDCSGDAGNKTCTSKASYKVKTRLN